MSIPQNIRWLKWLTAAWVIVAVVWAVLEGSLGWTVLFASLSSFIVVVLIARKILADRVLSTRTLLFAAAIMGLVWGIGSSILTLLFMALKTGLHAHGPEFSLFELNWVIQQIPIWSVAGMLVGIGLGLLLRAVLRSNS